MGAAIALGIERGYWVREDLVITTKIFNGATHASALLAPDKMINRCGSTSSRHRRCCPQLCAHRCWSWATTSDICV